MHRLGPRVSDGSRFCDFILSKTIDKIIDVDYVDTTIIILPREAN